MRVQLNLNMQLAEENLSGIALHLRHSCFARLHCQNILRWPTSRDYMWSSNVNHTQLDKIGCMRRIGSVVPGGGTILNMGWLSVFKGTLAFHIFFFLIGNKKY